LSGFHRVHLHRINVSDAHVEKMINPHLKPSTDRTLETDVWKLPVGRAVERC
jgi:hypothetical protein